MAKDAATGKQAGGKEPGGPDGPDEDKDAPQIDIKQLKAMLVRAKKGPLNCAIGVSKDGDALIKLDKMKAPRAVAKMLEDEFGKIKNPRWGTAKVDGDEDAKMVVLTLNRASPGMDRLLKETLRGTGITKVKITQ